MTHRLLQRLVAYVLMPGLSVVLVASAASAAVVAPHRAASHSQRGWMAPDANPNDPWLYVSTLSNSVLVYDLKKRGIPQVGTITAGISSPGGIALGPDGTLYVPNETNATTSVYAPGATNPTLTLTGADAPESAALDASGNVWILNRGGSPGIAVYAPGATTPMIYITSSLLTSPTQDVFDPGGTLYVGDNYTAVSYLLPGPSQTLTSLNLQDYGNGPSGLTENPATGDLYVSDYPVGAGHVSMYPPGQKYPSAVWQSRKSFPIDFLAFGLWGKHPAVFAPIALSPEVYILKPNLAKKPYAVVAVSANVIGAAYKPAGVP
jgi:hypothetical protein